MQSPAFFCAQIHPGRMKRGPFAAPFPGQRPDGSHLFGVKCVRLTAIFPEIHSLSCRHPPKAHSLYSPPSRRAASGKPGRRSPGIPPPAGRAAGDGSFSPKQRSGRAAGGSRVVWADFQDAQPRHFQSRISGRSTPYSRIYWSCSTSLSFISCTRWALRPPRSGR